MICQKCKKKKNENDFYFIDGGLGYRNDRMHWCKECIKIFNENRDRNKYLDEQNYAQYYGALEVLKGKKQAKVVQTIDNGMIESSKSIGISQYIKMIKNEKEGYTNYSKQQKRIYELILKKSANETIVYPDEIEDKNLYEGSKKQITVNAYERNPQARKECIKHYGYKCQICEFDFENVYGDIGKDFIHVHHKIDISTVGENYQVNPIKDLIPVCPNCHAMLHKRKPAYSPEEIKSQILKRTYNKS